MATGGMPRVNKISLRRAVAEVTTDDDVRKIARGLVDGAFDDDGKPRMDAINALIKLLPHVPSTASLERARVLAASNVEDMARLAMEALLAHVLEDATAEAASALMDGIAKQAAARKTAAETGAAAGNGAVTINIVSDANTSTTAHVVASSDEVTK